MVYGTRFGISVSRRVLASVIVLLLSVGLFIGIAGSENAEAVCANDMVAAGANHTLQIGNCGELRTWGYNLHGQLGDGTSGNFSTSTPTYVSSNWQSVYSGPAANHSFAIDDAGYLYAWGWNFYGQLGLGDKTNRTVPTMIGGGGAGSLVIETTTTSTSTTTTSLILQGDTWQSATAGYRHSAGIKSDGTLWTWGYNDYGQLGDGTKTQRLTPVQVGSASNWIKVVAGFRHTVALNGDGEVWAWGDNTYGQLGDGTNTLSKVPVQVDAPLLISNLEPSLSKKQKLLSKIKKAAGKTDRLKDGSVGATNGGPAQTWSDIAAGYYHTLAIANDPFNSVGNVYAWGWNANGQLGDGTIVNRNQPVQVTYAWGGFGLNNVSSNSILESFDSLSAGYYHSLAGNTVNCLYVWGNNGVGQLGNGTRTSSLIPIEIDENMNWGSHASGAKHNIAIKTDYSVWTWGYNATNQLGNGNKYTRYSPVKVIDASCVFGANVGINGCVID